MVKKSKKIESITNIQATINICENELTPIGPLTIRYYQNIFYLIKINVNI